MTTLFILPHLMLEIVGLIILGYYTKKSKGDSCIILLLFVYIIMTFLSLLLVPGYNKQLIVFESKSTVYLIVICFLISLINIIYGAIKKERNCIRGGVLSVVLCYIQATIAFFNPLWWIN